MTPSELKQDSIERLIEDLKKFQEVADTAFYVYIDAFRPVSAGGNKMYLATKQAVGYARGDFFDRLRDFLKEWL